MLDFYLIVSDYRAAYRQALAGRGQPLIPPNVFYVEHDGLVAKYAVLSEADFRRLAGPETRNVSVWARFAQPSRLVWAADEAARSAAVDAVARAAPTLLAAAATARRAKTSSTCGARAFALTYSRRASRRARRAGRDRSSIIDPDRYAPLRRARAGRARARLAGRGPTGWRGGGVARARRCRWSGWPRPARPSPAAPTISPGRSTATRAPTSQLKPWQRRHPLLAAIALLPRLIRSGAIR